MDELAPGRTRDYVGAMDQRQTQPAEHTETAEERTARLAREGEAIEVARSSLKERGGIPIEDIEAWVESWDTPGELPMPQPRQL
jgi:hypothetical protein